MRQGDRVTAIEDPLASQQRSGVVHVRSTTIRGTPDRIDDGVAYLRTEVVPHLDETAGCVGLSMLVERDTGRCIVATSWDDDDAMKASAGEIEPIRERLVQALGATDGDVRVWDVAVLHRERPAGDGAAAQVLWTRVPAARTDALLDAFRHNLVPRLQELPGFCSLSMLVDRRGGREVVVTSWESRDALERVRKEARHLRDQFITAVGAGIVDGAEMELAVAHLRVPETT
jgi:heme-degrading monooxygenase HmoA